MIEKQKGEIYAAATNNAKERVKLAFLSPAHRRAGKKSPCRRRRSLKHAQSLAAMYRMPFEQFLKDLQKRNGVNELYDQISHEKVLAFLETERENRGRSGLGRETRPDPQSPAWRGAGSAAQWE